MSTMTKTRAFTDIGRPVAAGATPVAAPVVPFMDELETIGRKTATAQNRVGEAVADGTLSVPSLKRLVQEYYFLGCYYGTELGSIVAHAPDADGLAPASSEHSRHWLRILADESGYGGAPTHLDMVIGWARQLGISDEELVGYRPMPETIGAVFTTLYYMRRSYEEGLAAFGWAGRRLAASTGDAKRMYEGMRVHYGIEVENFRAPTKGRADQGGQVDDLLRTVAVSVDQQRRIRRAIHHTLSVGNQRTVALNRWLDEPGALRRVGG
jgi:hypothetical protein